MTLSSKERALFIAWLEDTASGCKEMANQIDKLGGFSAIGLSKREKMKAAACLLIANDLKQSELQDIG